MNHLESEAFQLFETLASSRGWHILSSLNTRELWKSGARLRLIADERGLTLEVTHGPPDVPFAGWLDLFSQPNDSMTEMALADCITYGLDLMDPNRGK